MTRREARNIQRRYQRMGCNTWTSTVVYSGQEALGLQYQVHVLTSDGKEHTITYPHEVIGGIREMIIKPNSQGRSSQ